MRKALGDKHVQSFLDQHALPNEEILNWVEALRDGDTFQGRLIATNDRLVYYRKGTMSQKLEVWSISKISSVDAKAGILTTKLQLFTSGDKISLTIFGDKRHAKEFVNELQMAVSRPVDAQPPAKVGSDPFEALNQLAKLRDAGVVTEDEFIAKKTELLKKL